ncbi:hypothetical protein Pma05_28790 [Plantactinospora mayteni]|uniref:Uncharacterized protein n=1 Tax=Plantactinospora mayteni TaxID=566021 RepID=A0ABQ4ENR9_9ACTN|nr:hypothetical protein Pma05_28790 [Plantactinospora mayteni]
MTPAGDTSSHAISTVQTTMSVIAPITISRRARLRRSGVAASSGMVPGDHSGGVPGDGGSCCDGAGGHGGVGDGGWGAAAPGGVSAM